jgi:orotate phosphoribosyltransferase
MEYSRKIAEFLLECEAVKLSPEAPYTWASGWKSPIYCDNRKTLAFPNIRTFIKDALTEMISSNFQDVEVIAGVATGAIAQGALVADKLELPFCYVRSAPKNHGLENLIEGNLKKGQKVVVVEDLISTGSSSLKAVSSVREAGANVLGMMGIFSYQFPVAIDNFKEAGVKLFTLSNYNILIDVAIEKRYIDEKWLNILKEWHENPEEWSK